MVSNLFSTVNAAKLRHQLLSNIAFVVFGVMVVFGTIASPYFLTTLNITNVLRQAVPLALVSVGQTFVILAGGVDLSVGSAISLSVCLTCGIMRSAEGKLMQVLLAVLGSAILLGLFNGLITIKREAQPFIVTLGTSTMLQGVALVYTKGFHIGGVPASFRPLAEAYLGPIPVPVLYTAAVFALATVVLRRSRYGRYIYAVGGNHEAARLSGINVFWIRLSTYILSAVLAAFAGLFLASRMGIGDPIVGERFTLDCVGAVVIGGASFDGGIGSLGGTVAGVLIMACLSNLLNLLNISSFTQIVVKGVVIILAVTAYQLRYRGVKA